MSQTTGGYVGDLARVLTVNSQATQFESRPVVRREPPGTGENADETGLVGGTSIVTRAGQFPRVRLVPFATGGPDVPFYMRVTGFYMVRKNDADPNQVVWIELPIADFVCVTGNLPGKSNRPGQQVPVDRVLKPSEFLCDEILLMNGSLGVGDAQGDLVSYGPGMLVPAHVSLALSGVKPFKVQFASPDRPLEMNAFWVPC